jgi:hypothetical protein
VHIIVCDSVVFAGFSSDSLRDRIVDGHARFVITADEVYFIHWLTFCHITDNFTIVFVVYINNTKGRRGGKAIPLKNTVDIALRDVADVKVSGP